MLSFIDRNHWNLSVIFQLYLTVMKNLRIQSRTQAKPRDSEIVEKVAHPKIAVMMTQNPGAKQLPDSGYDVSSGFYVAIYPSSIYPINLSLDGHFELWRPF